jgi:hypothetical protein
MKINFNVLPFLISFSCGLLVLFVQQFARIYFNHSLFLGSAPNLLVGFCFPFCALIRPKLFTLKRARKFFLFACAGTLFLLIGFEVVRPFEGAKTFDYLDILASFAGAATAFLFYRGWLEKKLIFQV